VAQYRRDLLLTVLRWILAAIVIVALRLLALSES
jgi:predicted anti-sigma-YlaC factor YlaD